MAATIHPLPSLPSVTTPEPWEIRYAESVLAGRSPANAALLAEDAAAFASRHPEFEGVAQAMERLADVADVTRDMIREASQR